MSGKPISLRPHHGMCLAYFVGEGYSGEFTVHMGRVLASLSPDTPVKLTVRTDTVCGKCPNNTDGQCDKPALVEGYDRAVLAYCGLEEGQVLPFGDFTRLVQDRILAPGRREGICGSCQWNSICAGGTSRWAAPGGGLR